MLLDLSPDSDMDTGSDAGAANSSLSSTSTTSTASFARLSFDAATAAAETSPPATLRPHRSGDHGWAAIRAAPGPLGPKDFKLVRRIGSGDIGTVYLCRLRDSVALEPSASSPCLYAMKVADKQVLAKKHKLERAAIEKRILKTLDHPFLPTLFADFDASPHFSCVVMEFCPGGDLHALRHRMPGRRFPLSSARFYAAEVLLALEYLHMMGIVYRDLKPENILIRADGHIMLSDFDLSLESTSSPSLEQVDAAGYVESDAASQPSCFPGHLLRFKKRRSSPAKFARRFVAEPVAARSCSFVGTHEYVAPEVAGGGAHGSAVDWWAYGVFLYEMLYGRTPFAGGSNESTLRNVVRRPLAFPPGSGSCGPADSAARDLISKLLLKDPAARLGSRRGAADVKAHPFFKGLNFALLRSSRPPVVPGNLNRSTSCKDRQKPARFDYF